MGQLTGGGRLSMVYGFVTQSGGHVQIESEPGQGTRVVLWLPRSGAGAPPTRETDRAEALPGGRERAERALALRPELALLYTSGYPEEAISRNGRLEEGVALLAKPYRRRDLALQVRAVLDARTRD